MAATQLPPGAGHPFYDKFEGILAWHTFDRFVEERCAKFYADTLGRPSIPPVVYCKMLFIGYYESIGSETHMEIFHSVVTTLASE